jgi:hypothetical protein
MKLGWVVAYSRASRSMVAASIPVVAAVRSGVHSATRSGSFSQPTV